MTRQVNFHFLENAETCQGYEIHMGETRPVPGVSVVPLNRLEDGGEDGCLINQNVWEVIFMEYWIIRHL